MSRLSVEDEEAIRSFHPTDEIICLNMLKQYTIDSLNAQGVLTIHDLLQFAPVALMTLLGIDEDQRELLLDITEQLVLSSRAYDDLHG